VRILVVGLVLRAIGISGPLRLMAIGIALIVTVLLIGVLIRGLMTRGIVLVALRVTLVLHRGSRPAPGLRPTRWRHRRSVAPCHV